MKQITFFRNAVLVFASFLFCGMSFAQDVNILWDKTLGGTQDELFQYYKMPLRAFKGGYIVAGQSRSPVSGEKTEPVQGGSGYDDYWAVSLDANGTKLWDKRLGGNHKEYLADLLVLPGGNLIWIGFSWTMLPTGDKLVPNYTTFSGASPNQDAWIVKTDALGNPIWDRHFGSRWADNVWEAIVEGDKILIAGETSAVTAGDDIPNDARGFGDSWVYAIDTNGNFLWTNRFGAEGADGMNAIIPDGAGGYYIAGNADGPASFEVTDTTWGGFDYLLYRIDASGNILWDERYGSEGIWENIQDLELLPGGDVMLIGGSPGNTGDKSEPSRGGIDFWILRVNPSGNVVWEKTFGGNDDDEPIDAMISCEGNIVILGMSQSPVSGERTAPTRGGKDYWIIKIDPDGNLIWDIAMGGSGEDIGGGVQQGPDGSYFFAGISNSPISGEKTEACRGGYDFWVANIGVRAGFSVADTVCAEMEVFFTDSSSFNTTSVIWTFGDPASGSANTSPDKNPSHIFQFPGDYQVQLIVWDGCMSDTVVQNLHVLPAAHAITGILDSILCEGEEIALGTPGTAGVTYTWSPATNLSSSSVANPLFTTSSSGEWILTATNGLCTETDTMRITMIPDLAGLDTTICEGDTLTLGEYDLPGVTFSWSPAMGLDDPSVAYPLATPLVSVVYTLITSGDACVQTANWIVDVTPPPVPDFYFVPEQPEATQEIHFVNQSIISSVWDWSFGDGNSSALLNPVHAYLSDGNYVVALTAANEGCSRTLLREITIHSDPRIFIPNAFTPNGDGLNDVLEVRGLNMDGFEMSIYDRSGKLIEVMTDPAQGWDGNINGIAAPEGAYTYRLLFRSKEGERTESSGQVLLIR